MKPRALVWLAVCGGLVVALSAADIPGWVLGVVVAATLVLAIPLGVRRHRVERNLARMVWRALTTLANALSCQIADFFPRKSPWN